MPLILAILAVGFLIVVHEGGHYFVARWCSMRIDRFSVGFGPAILKTTSKRTGTTFQLAPIPFGGFVEIRGMNIVEEVDPDDRQAYPNRPAWQRFLTIFAGPATNYLSAVVMAFALYTCHGLESSDRRVVEAVLPGYDAAAKLAIQTFTAEPQPDDAVNVAAPAGGWDNATAQAGAAKPAAKPAKRAARVSAAQ